MKLAARILRAVSPEYGGPAPRTVLHGLARYHGYEAEFKKTLRALLDAGKLVIIGAKRGSVYGLPGCRRKR